MFHCRFCLCIVLLKSLSVCHMVLCISVWFFQMCGVFLNDTWQEGGKLRETEEKRFHYIWLPKINREIYYFLLTNYKCFLSQHSVVDCSSLYRVETFWASPSYINTSIGTVLVQIIFRHWPWWELWVYILRFLGDTVSQPLSPGFYNLFSPLLQWFPSLRCMNCYI